MSTTTSSPAKLVTKKKGRRLNAVPLVIGGVVLAGFATVIAYTVIQRSRMQQRNAAAVANSVPVSAQVPGFISARAADAPPKPAQPGSPVVPVAASTPVAPAAVAPVQSDDMRVKAWRDYFLRLDQINAAKAASATKAMESETGVDLGRGASEGQVHPAVPAAASDPVDGLLTAGTDAKAQAEKRSFLAEKGDTLGVHEDLGAVPHGPKHDTIMEGTAIPGVMVGGLNSDMPGMIVGMVMQNVYDTETGNDLLIPQGSRIIGKYDNSVSNGQSRIRVIWNRVIFPDTTSLQLWSMEGADQGGYAGFHDLVDRHFWEKFGNALLISIAGAGFQLSQPQAVNGQNLNSTQLIAGSVGQQFAELGQEYARAGMAIPNTLEVRPGYRFTVMVQKDIHLPPYIDHRTAGPVAASVGPVWR